MRAEEVTDAIMRELRVVTEEYVQRLHAGLPVGPLTQRTLGAVNRANAATDALAERMAEQLHIIQGG